MGQGSTTHALVYKGAHCTPEREDCVRRKWTCRPASSIYYWQEKIFVLPSVDVHVIQSPCDLPLSLGSCSTLKNTSFNVSKHNTAFTPAICSFIIYYQMANNFFNDALYYTSCNCRVRLKLIGKRSACNFTQGTMFISFYFLKITLKINRKKK